MAKAGPPWHACPMRPLLLALVLLVTAALALLSTPRPAAAGDFWEEVRTPGLRAWRTTMEDARQALRNRRFSVARRLASDAIGRLPDRAEAYAVRGLAAAGEQDHERALGDLRRALALDATVLDDPLAGYGPRAATALARAGATDDAVRVLARALGRMRPGGGRRALYGFYGDLLQLLGPERLEEARRAYREALRGGPGDAGVLLGLALAEHRAGLVEAGLATARQAVSSRNLTLLAGSRQVPAPEQAARRAVGLAAIGDRAGARTAWAEAAAGGGPWAAHATRAAGR